MNNSKISKMNKLRKLELSWRSCYDCKLSTHRTNVVFYRGNPDAKMLLIGEAPGMDEDLDGRPFVGTSGRELNNILFNELDINCEQDICIINVVGCRPYGNRQPKREEIIACRPRTEYMIRTIDPSVIVLLGGTAAKLAGINSVNPWRGKPLTMEVRNREYKAVVTYHPSYYLRNGKSKKIKKKIIFDLLVACSLMKKERVK